MEDSTIYRTTVNLPAISMKTLEMLAAKRGKTRSQVLRNAIATEKVLQEAADRGALILFMEKDGSFKRLSFA